MQIQRLRIPDVFLLKPNLFNDHRGRFFESHRKAFFKEECGLELNFVQGNVSFSGPNVLRGMHYQTVDGQGKLVRCLHGSLYDVAIDMREGSATFGRWVGHMLDAQDCMAIYVPPGFAHGFLAGSQGATAQYECTSYYVDGYNYCVKWNDPDANITWPLMGRDPVLSTKDRAGLSLQVAPKVKA